MSSIPEHDQSNDSEDLQWGRTDYTRLSDGTCLLNTLPPAEEDDDSRTYLVDQLTAVQQPMKAIRIQKMGWTSRGSRLLATHGTRERVNSWYEVSTGFAEDPWVFQLRPSSYGHGVPLTDLDKFGPNTIAIRVPTDMLNVYNARARWSDDPTMGFEECREKTLATAMTLRTYMEKRRRCLSEGLWMDADGELHPNGDDAHLHRRPWYVPQCCIVADRIDGTCVVLRDQAPASLREGEEVIELGEEHDSDN